MGHVKFHSLVAGSVQEGQRPQLLIPRCPRLVSDRLLLPDRHRVRKGCSSLAQSAVFPGRPVPPSMHLRISGSRTLDAKGKQIRVRCFLKIRRSRAHRPNRAGVSAASVGAPLAPFPAGRWWPPWCPAAPPPPPLAAAAGQRHPSSVRMAATPGSNLTAACSPAFSGDAPAHHQLAAGGATDQIGEGCRPGGLVYISPDQCPVLRRP